MIRQRIFRFISALLISILCCQAAQAQLFHIKKGEKKDDTPWFCGMAVQADMVGLGMGIANARFANMEAGLKANLREKYLPVFEMGIGKCTREGRENDNVFSTHAPYFRLGVDYNMNSDRSSNKYTIGARYGVSIFNYQFRSDDMADAVWGDPMPLHLKGLHGRAHWLEIVVGVQTRIWKFVHLGWNIRYKARLKQHTDQAGEPWYIPGFGKNDASCWGGTMNVIFDTGKWKILDKIKQKRQARKGQEEEVVTDSITTVISTVNP